MCRSSPLCPKAPPEAWSPESVTLDVCRRVIDRGILVTEAEILDAMRLVLETEHWLIEGAAAVAVAAFRKESARYQGKTAAIVICGRNLSPEASEPRALSSLQTNWPSARIYLTRSPDMKLLVAACC